MVSYPDGITGTADDVVGARVAAFVIDHILSFVFAVVVGTLLGALLRSDAGIYLGILLGFTTYFVVSEGAIGQTPGKLALGIVVVKRHSGEPISFGEAFVRNALRLVDGILSYAVGLVFMLLSDDRQRLGDRAAGTVVVRAVR